MIWAFWIDSVPITRAVLDGSTSLGGSESACLGLMRALVRRGHICHAFTPKLDPAAAGDDGQGVAWHVGSEFTGLSVFRHAEWDVFVALRMPYAIGMRQIPARYRILWNQDLLYPAQADATMGSFWQTDTLAYVSAYHRAQWEALLPTAAPLGWVTRNGYDPTLVPTDAVKDPRRIIHISRPERALVRVVPHGTAHTVTPGPLLEMWPRIRQARPDAVLHLCRYSSMYDDGPGGWGDVCRTADQAVDEVQAAVGGIVRLGELGKRELYQAIAESAVMWYPGMADFAETGCIAAVEAQACGTPFVGSYKGALPETAPHSVLIRGDAFDAAYQASSVLAVLAALDGCQRQTRAYREHVQAARAHVTPAYTYDAIAADWEAYVVGQMAARSADRAGVLRSLLLWDDLTTARPLAAALGAQPVIDFCDRVIAGQDQTAEDYATNAMDPRIELAIRSRFDEIVPWYAETTRLLDVACGNGTAILKLLDAYPGLTAVGVDYAQANIDTARAVAEERGVGDRATWVCLPVYDYATHALAQPFLDWLQTQAPFDGMFVGEFLEHCANATGLIDGLEQACAPGALVGYTFPRGPWTSLMGRGRPVKYGHVHAFELDDVLRVFGEKADVRINAENAGASKRGYPLATWFVTYRALPGRPTGTRDPVERRLKTRPHPRLSALIITHNEAANLAACLDSIWGVADEIVVGDCGSTDETREIAQRYGAQIIPLPVISAATGFDFSDARNAVLERCVGEWVLWIDADETLEGASDLGKYLESGPFLGYAIPQVHLMIDAPPHHDLPVRVFRRLPEIRWYGSIHEQPQMGDANKDIWPALELAEVKIAHRGYRTIGLRYQKRKRNLPLLELDRQRYPERRLGLVLWIRDLVQEAEDEIEQHAKQMTEMAANYLTEAVDVFEREFTDPADKLYPFARPWYERAVKLTTDPWEFAVTLTGQPGGLNGSKPTMTRVWVRKAEDIAPLLQHQLARIQAARTVTPILLEPPPPERSDELAPQ